MAEEDVTVTDIGEDVPEEDKEAIDKTTTKGKCGLYLAVIFAIIGFVTMILAVIAYTEIKDFSSDFVEIVQTWRANPVADIDIRTTACPAGWAEATFSWGGTKPACDCPANSDSSSSSDSSCTSTQTNNGCTDRSAVAAINNIRPFPGLFFCVFSIPNTDSLNRPQSKSSCPAGYHMCGTPNTDGAFCFPDQAYTCPVTDIFIGSSAPTGGAANKSIAIGTTGLTLYIQRAGVFTNAPATRGNGSALSLPSTLLAPSGLPITNLGLFSRFSCYLGGCGFSGRSYSAAETAFRTANPTLGYTLEETCTGCKSSDKSDVSPDGTDVRYFPIYGAPEPVMYSPAGVPSQFADSNYNIELAARPETLWKAGCTVDKETVRSRESDVTKVKDLQLGLMLLTVLSWILLGLVWTCVRCYRPAKAIRYKTRVKICKFTLKLISIVLTIVTAVVCFSTLDFWQKINEESVAASTGCTDPLSAETFSVLGDKFESLSKKDIVTVVTSGLDGIADAVASCMGVFT